MISIGDLQVIYSGGAANTLQSASLGGAISTAGANKVVSQTTTAPTNVTGVTILDAMGNALGNGTIKWSSGDSTLQWKPFGAAVFDSTVVSGNGNYTVGSSSGYIYVSVVFANLPASTVQDSITVDNAANKAFDNISAVESLSGDVEYRCFFIKNTSTTDIAYDVKVWVKAQPTGSDTLSICLDTNGLNAAARGPLANEQDSTAVLSGMTWVQPSSYANALTIGNLAPLDYHAFWIRRTVPNGTTTQQANDISALAISAMI